MKLLLRNVWGYYSQQKLYCAIYFIGVIFDLAVESFVALSFKFLLDNAIIPKNQKTMILILSLLLQEHCYPGSVTLSAAICIPKCWPKLWAISDASSLKSYSSSP